MIPFNSPNYEYFPKNFDELSFDNFKAEINFQSIENKNNLLILDTKVTYKSPWTINFRFPSRIKLFYEVDNIRLENFFSSRSSFMNII